jgi:uncharacterized membrane protein YqgA involved in biofilm formation
MVMTGTIINIVAVILGGVIGLFLGNRLPDRFRSTITAGLGLFTATIGISLAIKTQQPLIVLGSLLVGGILGEWWRIEDRLRNLGSWFETKFQTLIRQPSNGDSSSEEDDTASTKSSRFIRGFMTASLVYCIGPVTILGSIQDGLSGDYNLLAIKSVMDGFASIAFASSLGVGVIFSSIVILIYQGGLTLLAAQVQSIVNEQMMTEMTAVGGVLLLGIAISSLLEIKPIRVGNFLPALFIAPIIVALIN